MQSGQETSQNIIRTQKINAESTSFRWRRIAWRQAVSWLVGDRYRWWAVNLDRKSSILVQTRTACSIHFRRDCRGLIFWQFFKAYTSHLRLIGKVKVSNDFTIVSRYLFKKAVEAHNWANRTILTNRDSFLEKQQPKKRKTPVVYEITLKSSYILRNAVAEI